MFAVYVSGYNLVGERVEELLIAVCPTRAAAEEVVTALRFYNRTQPAVPFNAMWNSFVITAL